MKCFTNLPQWAKCTIVIAASIIAVLFFVLLIAMPFYLALTTGSMWFFLLYCIPVGVVLGIALLEHIVL